MLTAAIALVFAFTFVLGGYAQVIVARFARDLDRSAPLLATGVASSVFSLFTVVWLGNEFANALP
ncbi:MAG: hypothetical protein WA985_11295, partial [Erythrobacter sp.]